MRAPELLAPAGDRDSFFAAVHCGADAVYLGLSDFNARMKAENFTADNIAEYVSYAHFYGVKVYITVNTILHNTEFNRLYALIKAAVCAKADAFIVQDAGAAYFLRECFPGIELHASTQMGVHNAEGALAAKSMGIKRVVLSRETKAEDIAAIKRIEGLEVEYFVHGALCVAFSGNCYLSYDDNGASGNRGVCRQLCRQRYCLTDGRQTKEGYFLSAKDLCLIDSVNELMSLGVDSFKIEGRLRRAGYVAEAVTAYRRAIDRAADGAEYKATAQDMRALATAFGRGDFLTRAYLDAGKPQVIDAVHNNHFGAAIGKVLSVRPYKDIYKISIESDTPVRDGDGLKFAADGREAGSIGVKGAVSEGRGRYTLFSRTAPPEGAEVRLILDAERERTLLSSVRSIKIVMRARAMRGEPLMLTVSSAEHRGGYIDAEVTVTGEEILEAAKNEPATEQDICAQLAKTGDSGFCAADIKADTDGVFIAKSRLNAIRREALEKLRAKLTDANAHSSAAYDDKAAQRLLDTLKYAPAPSAEKLTFAYTDGGAAADAAGKAVICAHDLKDIRGIRALAESLGAKEIYLDLPSPACGADMRVIKRTLDALKDVVTGVVSENVYGLYFKQFGYRVIAGIKHNTVNYFSAVALKEAGAEGVVFSPEVKEKKSALPVLSADGYALPLMTLAHCPLKTLRGQDCASCKGRSALPALARAGEEYSFRRVRMSECIFELIKKQD